MERQLEIADTKGDIDVSVGGIVRSFNGRDVCENAFEHIVYQSVIKIFIGYKNIVNINCKKLTNDRIGYLFDENTYTLFGVVTNKYKVKGLTMTINFTK